MSMVGSVMLLLYGISLSEIESPYVSQATSLYFNNIWT